MVNFTNNIACVRRYHQQTKHQFERYANGPETLDWSMQPDPFRKYEGAEKFQLPFSSDDMYVKFCDLYASANVTTMPIDLGSIGTLLELSLGLSAWKEYQGDRWALRCNPSSGNLHPTEAYVIGIGIENLPSGVYHYASYDHTLEQRCAFHADESVSSQYQEPFILLGLSSVFWREAWKYGERAFRYCQLDVGHAIAAIRYACAALGWSAQILPGVDDDTIAHLLGLNRSEDFDKAEREHADLLMKIVPLNTAISSFDIEKLIEYSQNGQWSGNANVLDQHHLYQWPIIDEVAAAARSIKSESSTRWIPGALPSPLPCNTTLQAKEIIQRRRSAQLFDGVTEMESDDFFRVLDMLIPRKNIAPWDTFPWQPRIHPVFFIHRIKDLNPGLYIMLRNENALDSLKSTLSDKMQWLPVTNAPAHLNLYCLVNANAKKAAATLSCHQRIASDSVFSLAMLSEFDTALEAGSWNYKHLYWEAGILGQALYLEAEAIDLQGTGIGCFFDDPVHETLGIKDTQFQSLYHFTIGAALKDNRLRTLMPYAHLDRD